MRVRTRFGNIVLSGQLSASADRPVLFVIRGLFPPPDHLEWLEQSLHDEADVLLAHLPGMHTPNLVADDIETMSAAFREATTGLLGDRDVVICGVSTGALVALGLGAGSLGRSVVLLEPFLRMEGCWPLRETLERMSPPGSSSRPWTDAVFGPECDADYRYLLDNLAAQTFVLVGGERLEPRRPVAKLPSLASQEERQIWAAAAGVRYVECVGAGHNIPDDARPQMMATLREALSS